MSEAGPKGNRRHPWRSVGRGVRASERRRSTGLIGGRHPGLGKRAVLGALHGEWALGARQVNARCFRATGGYDRGLSAQRSSRPTHGQKSRRGPELGQAEPPHRGQVTMKRSWRWDSNLAATRGRENRSRGRPAPSQTALSRPPHAGAGSDEAALKAFGRKGASLELGNRGIQRVLVDNWSVAETGKRHLLQGERAGSAHASGKVV
jgi:hypothetical protein